MHAVDREDQSHVVGRLGRLEEESLKGPKLSKQTGSAHEEGVNKYRTLADLICPKVAKTPKAARYRCVKEVRCL